VTDEEFVQAELWKVANAVRREVAEEIAAAIEVRQNAAGRAVAYEALALAARIAREIGSKETGT